MTLKTIYIIILLYKILLHKNLYTRYAKMKEKIYTIPVTEAYEADCSCPLCFLEEKLEKEAIEYALGAAMMEPDYRIESNEKGYCNKHFERMHKQPNKLSLALVLETHLEEIRKKLSSYEEEVLELGNSKAGFFKKNTDSDCTDKISTELSKVECECIVCNKVNHTMERYCDVLLYMWANDESFREKFQNSHGVCLKHERKLLQIAYKSLNTKHANAFIKELYALQKAELEKHQEYIHKFVLKFDYRFHDMELGEAQNAVCDVIEKISGYIDKE